MSDTPYSDSALPIAQRVDDLLSRMTIEEKAGQLSQFFYLASIGGELPADFDITTIPPEHRAFLEQPKMVERSAATGRTGSVLFVTDAATANRLQRLAVEQSRLGIPLLFGFDVIHGFRTMFPAPIALAASWDPDVIEAAQATAAGEARAVGIRWTFAPMVDIAPDPRWGRMFEGAGEDPHLGAAVAAAQVRGFQQDLGDTGILAGAKHFVGYGASRGGRDYDEVDLSDSELWNVYLPPFQAAIDAGSATVMSAYMELNGVPASANRHLLTDVLRDKLGFDGFVVSDASAVRNLVTQHVAASHEDAAARALNAGLDMEMTMLEPAFWSLPDAVASGAVREEDLDTAVRRILTAKFRLGLFENPYVDEGAASAALDAGENRLQARAAAEKTFVLLKNTGALLPLKAELRRIALIGQLGDSKRDTLGPWAFAHDTSETVTILEGLRARLGDHVEITYAPGAGIPARIVPSPFDRSDPTVVNTPADHDDDTEIARAVQAAEDAEVAIVVVGQRQNQTGETASVSTLDLPGRQLEQLRRIVATGTPVVLLVMSGRPLDLRWADANVPAIMQIWYPGTRGGDAVAAALLGDVSPAGRLPFTWPRHVGQVPMTYLHVTTFAPQDQERRYWNEPSTPLYPFGHGLSYAQFAYSDLRLTRDTIAVGEETGVTVTVTNTTGRDADEVAQLYIHQRHGTSARPVRELKGFERVHLRAGESRTLSFPVGPDQLCYWSAVTGGHVQDATTIDIWVGGSSRADLATELTVTPVAG
jgi:beta-glucosidase